MFDFHLQYDQINLIIMLLTIVDPLYFCDTISVLGPSGPGGIVLSMTGAVSSSFAVVVVLIFVFVTFAVFVG